jgi:hypothetical protein
MSTHLDKHHPAVRLTGVGAMLAIAMLAGACRLAPGAGSPSPTPPAASSPPASQSQMAPAAPTDGPQPTPMNYY